MSPPPHHRIETDVAETLVAVAPLATRWIERLLAGHDPPLTLPQYLTLSAIADGETSGTELARRTGVSGPAVSQLLGGLASAQLIDRQAVAGDRRRHALELSVTGRRALRSAQALLRRRIGSLLAPLPPAEAAGLARALPLVQAALSGNAPPRRPTPRRPPPPGPAKPRRRGP